jgi:hypothetical protein
MYRYLENDHLGNDSGSRADGETCRFAGDMLGVMNDASRSVLYQMATDHTALRKSASLTESNLFNVCWSEFRFK